MDGCRNLFIIEGRWIDVENITIRSPGPEIFDRDGPVTALDPSVQRIGFDYTRELDDFFPESVLFDQLFRQRDVLIENTLDAHIVFSAKVSVIYNAAQDKMVH